MTTSGMSYSGPKVLQNQTKNRSEKLPPGLVPPNGNIPNGNIPNGNNRSRNDKTDSNQMPNVMICFKSTNPSDKNGTKKEKDANSKKKGKDADSKKKEKDEDAKKQERRGKRSKSCELRASILYHGCECEKRNGLQDDCPRSECHGSPECLTLPPTCGPSEFAGGKHLTKIADEWLKKREEATKKLKKDQEGASGSKSDKKGRQTDYDCYPFDVLMQEGEPCPICSRVIGQPVESEPETFDKLDKCSKTEAGVPDKSQKLKKDNLEPEIPPVVYIGPVIIEFPADCMCPGAL